MEQQHSPDMWRLLQKECLTSAYRMLLEVPCETMMDDVMKFISCAAFIDKHIIDCAKAVRGLPQPPAPSAKSE